jgi:hypothetical protein
MTFASLRAAAQHIARTGTITPHQLAALTRLEETLSDQQRQTFTELWRAEGSPAGPVPPQGANTWEGIRAAAQAAGARYPELVAAQWALESAHGKAPSGRNNYWGLKGSGTSKPTWEVVNGQAVDIVASFLDFDSIAAGVEYLVSRWYKDFKGYKGVDRAASREDAARQLVAQGYATDPAYAQKLIALMDQHAPRPKVATPVQQPAKVTPASPFSTLLTPHIQVGEFALFQESRRFDRQHQVDTAAELAAFMERCRKQFGGKPVIITSGYRPPAVNRSVGGASGSEHLFNAPGVGAVDFYIKGISVQAVQGWCDINWPYSLGYGAPKGFVHLGIRAGRPRVRWDY